MKTEYNQEQLIRSGIYAIIHRESGKRYVGSTAKTFRQRWKEHKILLDKGKHHSRYLQHSWNKYSESAFDFVILEFVDPNYCVQREQWWMDLYGSYLVKNGYNASSNASSPLGVKRTASQIQKRTLKGYISYRDVFTVYVVNRRRFFLDHFGSGNRVTPSQMNGKNRFWISSEEETLNSKYQFRSPHGSIFYIFDLVSFCKLFKLSNSDMQRLARNKLKSHKGWTNISTSVIVYKFLTPEETVVISYSYKLREFCSKNNLESKYIYRLIKGERKSYKNWRLLSQSIFDQEQINIDPEYLDIHYSKYNQVFF